MFGARVQITSTFTPDCFDILVKMIALFCGVKASRLSVFYPGDRIPPVIPCGSSVCSVGELGDGKIRRPEARGVMRVCADDVLNSRAALGLALTGTVDGQRTHWR